MIRIFRQYMKILGNAFIGLAFGFSFFYLFLNIYHYREIRREVYVNFNTDSSIQQLDTILKNANDNIQKFNLSQEYHGRLEYGKAALWKTRLDVCVNSFHNKTFQELRNKNVLTIKDVYKFRESFENDVLNGCIVTHLYTLTNEFGDQDAFVNENKVLLQNYMDDLLQDTSYLKKDMNNNNSYYFTTDVTSLLGKNNTRDGFYEVVSSYIRSAKFLESISLWYANGVGGTV